MSKKEKGRGIGAWLAAQPIKSFSPNTGMLLLEIAKEVRDALAKSPPGDPAVKLEAERYWKRLIAVADVGCAHQGHAIFRFQQLIGGDGA